MQQLSITLPNEMVAMVRTEVKTGEYASESEIIRDCLRALAARDHAVEMWLRETVVPAAQSLRYKPSRALSAAQVRSHLTARRSRTTAK